MSSTAIIADEPTGYMHAIIHVHYACNNTRTYIGNLTAVNNTNVGCSGDIIQLNCTHSYNKTVAISWMKNGTHINKAPLGDEGETFSLLNVTLKGNVSGQSTFLYSCNLHHIDTNENEACNDILVIVNCE